MLGAGPQLFDRGQCRVFIDMARTGAVTQLTHSVEGVRIFIDLVRAPLEITLMTTAAVGLQGWERPGDHL